MKWLKRYRARRRIKAVNEDLAVHSAHLQMLESCARGREFTPYEQAEWSIRIQDKESLYVELGQLQEETK